MSPRTRWYLSGLIAALALFGACAQARAEDIPLIKKGGVYGVPVVLEQKTTIRYKSLHIWGTTSYLHAQ